MTIGVGAPAELLPHKRFAVPADGYITDPEPKPSGANVRVKLSRDPDAIQEGISVAEAQKDLLGEKQPSLQFVTPAQLGDLAVFLCSPGGDHVRGACWNVDGGWLAQ